MEFSIDLNSEQTVSSKSRELLLLCYDSIVDIDGYYMIASLDNKWGIINSNNETVVKFTSEPIYKIGNCVFKGHEYSLHQISLDGFDSISDKYTSAKPCWELALVRGYGRIYGIVDSKGVYVLPLCYRYLKISKETQTHIEIYAVYGEHNLIIKIDKRTLKPDKYDQIDVEGTDISFIGCSCRINKGCYMDAVKIKYNLYKSYKKVTSTEYDSMMYLSNYRRLGFVSTWNDGYAGMITVNGETLVDNDNKYSQVEAIGYNNIFLVKKQGNWGVYVKDKGETVKTVFDYTVIEPTLGFTYLYRRYENIDDWWILGNDGRAYKKLNEAFQIRTIDGTDRFTIDIYGRQYTVNSQLKKLK